MYGAKPISLQIFINTSAYLFYCSDGIISLVREYASFQQEKSKMKSSVGVFLSTP
jgi:hypothetical protein